MTFRFANEKALFEIISPSDITLMVTSMIKTSIVKSHVYDNNETNAIEVSKNVKTVNSFIYQHRIVMFRKAIILSQNGKLMINNLYTSQERGSIKKV